MRIKETTILVSVAICLLLVPAMGQERKILRSFPPSREEKATLRGFSAEQDDLNKAISAYMRKVAKANNIPDEDLSRFGYDAKNDVWVLVDVAPVQTSTK